MRDTLDTYASKLPKRGWLQLPLTVYGITLPNARGRKDSTARCRGSKETLSPVRERLHDLSPLRVISNLKRLNFENRTDTLKCRASERSGPLGE